MTRLVGLALSWVLALTCACSSAQFGTAQGPPEAVEPPRPVPPPPPADGMYAYTSPGELPQLVVIDVFGRPRNLPLEHTDVAAQVHGHVAHVRVAQEFHNDRKQPIEVTYTFPLPENAAVDAMRMRIGERVIEAEIQRRDAARATYEQARADGYTSALLEQERPSVFTQSVANVPPGERIVVEIGYLQTLSQDAGTYEFVFPMVVGPRFVPSADAVPDAARIMPPVLGKGTRTGHDVSLALDVSLGSPITLWDAPTHVVIGEPTTDGFSVALADAETIPNRDFVIRWKAASMITQARLLLGPRDDAGVGHLALIIQPPALDLDELVGRREMIFVVDRSGSMSGVPLALAKQTLREALRRLRPVDTFDVIGFESGTERLFGAPRPANQENLVLAERFIDGLEAGGGTRMAGAVEAALEPKLSENRDRYVFFLTDGYIGNEDEILASAGELVARAKSEGLRARVFGVGIGAAPNAHLIEGLSRAGRGVALRITNREHPRATVDRWYHYMDHPIAENLAIDWGGLEVLDRYPSELPDLFASHAAIVLGRYSGELRGDVALEARLASRTDTIMIPVEVVTSELDDRTLSTLWAREKIADITALAWDGLIAPEAFARDITALGLEHGLVTAFTSFVAVDRSRVIGAGDPLRVVQPVEVPEDVDAILAGSNVAHTIVDESGHVIDAVSFGADAPEVVTLTVSEPAFAGVSPRAISYSESRMIRSSSAYVPSYEARLSLVRIDTSDEVDARALRRSITRQSLQFETCYEQRGGPVARREIRLRLRFDPRSELYRVEILAGTLGNESVDGCVEAVLRRIDWRGLPASRSTVDLELALRMR